MRCRHCDAAIEPDFEEPGLYWDNDNNDKCLELEGWHIWTTGRQRHEPTFEERYSE